MTGTSFPGGVAEAKQRLPLPQLMERMGEGAHVKRSARCPFHEDRHASFSVFTDGGGWYWKCHAGCGEGDEVNYIQHRLNLSQSEAVRRFCDMAGTELRVPQSFSERRTRPSALHPPKPLVPVDMGAVRDYGMADAPSHIALAKKRRLPQPLGGHGIMQAGDQGLLRFGQLTTHGKQFDCWFTTDQSRYCVIARRMDGHPLPTQGGEAKAKCLQGSNLQWPIGIIKAQVFPVILLVEGGPDGLAASAAIMEEGRWRDAAVVVMASASPAIHPEALPHFSGKRVRIFADDGHAGEQASRKWHGQLLQAGATPDILSLADVPGISDLEELMRLPLNHRLTEQGGAQLVPQETN